MTHRPHITQALALIGGLIVLMLPVLGFEAWAVLTLAGLSMAMMIFVMASGMTLVFGLMDVLNFGHGAFIAVGAYAAASAVALAGGYPAGTSLAIVVVLGCALAAMLAGSVGGVAFERLLVRPAYGNHMRQILITTGGLIIVEQALILLFSPKEMVLLRPEQLQGSLLLGSIALERYRLLMVAVGLVIFGTLVLLLNRTKLGLLIRAAVENREMVEALGYPVRGLFTGVFIAGSGLAGIGGALWALQQELFTVTIGSEAMLLIFIVVVTGGLGSVSGCFFAALLTALVANYVTFLYPPLSAFALIGMMAAVLLWRPQGLVPVANR